MREHFDLDSSIIYLNSGTHSICPRSVREAVTRHQREYERNPTASLLAAWPRIWESQTRLAAFFGAEPRDLLLRTNVTHAMNDFILGVPLPRGSEILVTDLEYGAVVNTCRHRAARDGLTVRELHLPLDADAAALAELLTKALEANTKLVVLSHVCSGTGHVLPIEAIGRATRERGILLAVDGAHAPGALALDFSKLGDVDFYGGNLHKWLMGPKGTGFAWVNPRAQALLEPLMAGWPTFEKPDYFGTFGGGSRFAERFAMLGCHDFAPFFAITELLEFWERHGAAALRTQITWLQDIAERAMSKLGWPCLSAVHGPLRGPLLTYALPARLEARGGHPLMNDLLNEIKVQVSVPRVQGKWVLRLSPHVYNSEDEIRDGVNRIANFAG